MTRTHIMENAVRQLYKDEETIKKLEEEIDSLKKELEKINKFYEVKSKSHAERVRHMTFPGVKGYATYMGAYRKIMKEVDDSSDVTTMVLATPEGRFIPVALGEKALQMGLHFRGICVTN